MEYVLSLAIQLSNPIAAVPDGEIFEADSAVLLLAISLWVVVSGTLVHKGIDLRQPCHARFSLNSVVSNLDADSTAEDQAEAPTEAAA